VGEAPVPVTAVDDGRKTVVGNSNRFVGGDARVEHAVELDTQPLFVINYRFAESCKLAETSLSSGRHSPPNVQNSMEQVACRNPHFLASLSAWFPRSFICLGPVENFGDFHQN
jgi:hypothetical protein